MSSVSFSTENDILTIRISGHIDAANGPDVENSINEARAASQAKIVTVDCQELNYISSAGLRVILRLKKAVPDLKLINVLPEVYDIFETTGFTRMIDIQKAYRTISVSGCEVIGRGSNGTVYRIDRETIVKVFSESISLSDIQKERELARTAFVLGIPTAIPYDVVRIKEGGFGSVFELLDAKSFAQLLINGEKTADEIASMNVDLLRSIHSTEAEPGSIPDMKQIALEWAEMDRSVLEPEAYEKLCRLIKDIPDDHHMIHGDLHIKNVLLQGDEALLIDMDSLACGHLVFEFAGMFNAYCGFSELDRSASAMFLGISHDIASRIWEKSLSLYLGSDDEAYIKSVEEKAMILGYARLLRREIRIGAQHTEEGRHDIECIKTWLEELLKRTDSLVF